MKYPKCQYKGCRKASVCYLPEKKLYLCQQDSITQYSNYDSVPLVDDSFVEMNLKAIKICTKNFLAFTQMLNNGSNSPDEEDLSTTVGEELERIFEELKEAQDTHKYYKFQTLSNKALGIKGFVEQHRLYVEFLVARAWSQSLSIAKGESLKSAELIEMELKREYSATFDTMFQKFKELRHDIEQRHQQEVDELCQKNQNYKEEKKSLKRRKKELITEYNKLVDDYEELDQKAQGLEQKAQELEQNVTALEEENKEKDAALQALREKNSLVNKKLRRTKRELEESKQSAENFAEKLNEEITRSKTQQALLEKQKDSHAQSLAEVKKDKDTALKALQDTLSAKDEELGKILQNHKEEVSEIFGTKEEELKKSELEKENLQTDRDNMKKELISKLNLSECSDLSLLYKITTGKYKQFGPKTRLELKLNNPKHMEFLTSLNKRMPDIDILNLYNIPLNCQEVKTFLATHFPNKVRFLNFNYGSPLSNCLPFYLEELLEVSQRVTGQLYIHNFEVSQDQLAALFSANRHKERFGFTGCKLSLSSVPDFGGTLVGSMMQVLSLMSWCGSSFGGWGNNECHFENLIAGLSKEEDFRKNLKKIRMGWCRMEKNVVEKILADHGFGHVEIDWY